LVIYYGGDFSASAEAAHYVADWTKEGFIKQFWENLSHPLPPGHELSVMERAQINDLNDEVVALLCA